MATSAPQGTAESRSSVLLKTAQPLMPRFSVLSPLQLQANVDLNLPPPDWLHTSSPATVFSRAHFITHQVADSEPSSTALASHYPHVVGEVDVISDSQNIKKLLKLPYCGSPVSMAIHRVGKTLLVDEFAAPINLPTGVAASLDKLFEDNMLQLWFTARKKRPALTRHRNMFSKLLHYSVADRALLPATDSGETIKPQDIPSIADSSEATVEPSHVSSTDSSKDSIPDPIDKTSLSCSLSAQGDSSVDSQSLTRGEALCSVDRGGSQMVEETCVSSMTTTLWKENDGPHLVANGGDGGEEDKQFLVPTFVDVSSVLERRESGRGEEVERVEDGEGGERVGEEAAHYKPFSEETGGRRERETTFPYPPPLPKPRLFHHDVQWDIADIRMLLGSDLPIFGRDSHPAISLRLRDMEKPITVLTGLDYWLDNLMCNVPELAMCFHLDGVVQRYETVKTEDIPNLENSEFSPQEVLAVAQNILAFLKSNCTREGHTYWLFRRRGDDVVKLYDITSLMEMSSAEDEKKQNPFARSVALLFYRVASNMLNSPDGLRLSGEELNMVKLLLENCIHLLRDSYSDNVNISSSACYLLADLYLNRSVSHDHRDNRSHDLRKDIHTRSCDRKLSINSEEDEGEEEEEEDVSTACLSFLDSKSLSVSALRQGPQTFPDDPTHPLPPLMLGCSRDRARLALESVAKGITILGESLFSGPSPPSPEEPLVSHHSTPSPEEQLARTCGSHLLEKAGSAYLSLAVSCTANNKYGRALRYARYALLCFRGSRCVVNGVGVQESVDHFLSWQQCGDLHCLISKKSSLSDFEDFQLENPEDTPIIAAATRLRPPETEDKEEACLTIHSNRETSLWRSIDCYESALQLTHSLPPPEMTSDLQRTLKTHFANAWNELGTYYMVVSSSLDYAQEKDKVNKLWMCSYSCLSRGLELYDVADSTTALNRATTYANMGCLSRACASVHTRLAEAEGAEFSSEENTYYEKSLQYYVTAQQLLKRQSADPEFWCSLMCDLGCMYNAVGKHMLDRPPLSKLSPSEVERKVIDSLMKSLHCIEPQLSLVKKNTPRYRLIHQLAGESHYRLGSLYQKSAFSHSSSPQKQKHSRTQSEKHYSKAYLCYLPEHHAKDILRLLLEKSTLYELQVQGQGAKHQIRLLENALSSLLLCESTLQHYQPQTELREGSDSGEDSQRERVGNAAESGEGESGEEGEEVEGGGKKEGGVVEGEREGGVVEGGGVADSEQRDPLVSLVLCRLLSILKQLVATAMQKSDSSKSLASYKAMYAVALRGSQSCSGTVSEQVEQTRSCLRTVASTRRD